MIEGIGIAGKTLGKFIGSVPFLEKGPVDGWLRNGGDKLLKDNDKKVSRVVSWLNTEEKTGSELFVDSIRNISMISNQTTDILFDGEALYLAIA